VRLGDPVLGEQAAVVAPEVYWQPRSGARSAAVAGLGWTA